MGPLGRLINVVFVHSILKLRSFLKPELSDRLTFS